VQTKENGEGRMAASKSPLPPFSKGETSLFRRKHRTVLYPPLAGDKPFFSTSQVELGKKISFQN
jgi:hypothetical protein